MKLNDIYINLKNTINLKRIKRLLNVSYILKKEKNIDNLKRNLKNININKKNTLKIEQQKNNIFDGVNYRKKRNNIDLKKIIKSSKKVSFIISDFFSDLHFNFKNKKNIFKISAYIILFFSLLLLDKIIIQNIVSSGINNLYNIQYIKKISDLEIQLSKAKTKFNFANILFLPFKIIPEQNLINANNAIQTLSKTSQLGLDFTDFYKKNINFIKNKKIGEIYFANLFNNSKNFFINTENKLKDISKNIEKIKLEDKNSIEAKKLKKLKKYTKYTYNKLDYINNNFDTFLNILGKNRAKKYFIVFQNNDEIRPTGGFMGSAGIIEIFAGKIKSFEKKDIYAYEWDVKKNYTENVKGPTGVNLLSKRLGLRDSNAFLNINSSSKSINYFMKKGGYNLDGIIYLNQKPILDILEKVGNINYSKYDSIINNKNFSEIISILVEAKVSKKATLDTPKQVLFDFSKLLKKKILEEKKYTDILKVLINNIKSRDIVLYSFNKKENEILTQLGINGYFDYKKQTDFNFPFFISIGGNKSDRYIKRKYIKSVDIEKNKENNLCNLKTNFEIILENTFNKDDEKRIKNTMEKFRITPTKDLINIAGLGLNQDFTKIIIPKNAIINEKIMRKYGVKIIRHGDYVTAEKLLKTKAGDKSYMTINYELKNINCNKQNFKIYKQSGIYNYDVRFGYLNQTNKKSETIKLDGLKEDFYYNK